jgi:hypothetical protein
MNFSIWTEPVIVTPDNLPQYPYDKIWQSESGHSIELDDTPTRERLRLQHRDGSFQEFQPKGDVVTKVLRDNYQIVAGNNNVLIEGQCNITVNGACVIHVLGDGLIQIDGNLQQIVNGDLIQTVSGATNISTNGDIDIASKGDIGFNADNINVNGNLNVTGGITSAQSISATKNISAGLQSSAAIGFVTPGYVSAGSPLPLVPLPGWIAGIMVKDIQSTMVDMRVTYNIHTHADPQGGVVSSPLEPMI